MKFKVTMIEGTRTLVKTCDVPSVEEVIRIYGLNEPDITDYKIEEIKE